MLCDQSRSEILTSEFKYSVKKTPQHEIKYQMKFAWFKKTVVTYILLSKWACFQQGIPVYIQHEAGVLVEIQILIISVQLLRKGEGRVD